MHKDFGFGSPPPIVADTAREKVAAMMLRLSLATGHGDTLDDLLGELEPQIRDLSMRMIKIDGKLIAPKRIVSAEVETRHYMNVSACWLVVKLDDGSTIRREHGFGFDAFAVLDRIKAAG